MESSATSSGCRLKMALIRLKAGSPMHSSKKSLTMGSGSGASLEVIEVSVGDVDVGGCHAVGLGGGFEGAFGLVGVGECLGGDSAGRNDGIAESDFRANGDGAVLPREGAEGSGLISLERDVFEEVLDDGAFDEIVCCFAGELNEVFAVVQLDQDLTSAEKGGVRASERETDAVVVFSPADGFADFLKRDTGKCVDADVADGEELEEVDEGEDAVGGAALRPEDGVAGGVAEHPAVNGGQGKACVERGFGGRVETSGDEVGDGLGGGHSK